ncbi:MAG: Holliday junction branch migration protein RuvA [Atopostipes suicloacalis]|nr:Holliday junction branch migration protein RuvA [Atopostipes suicloacalis]
MYEYIIGVVKEVNPSFLVLENHQIGYHIYIANPFRLSSQLENESKVYIYQSVTQDDIRLYGFVNREEKELFLKLIGVSGIGPKSALAILAAEDHIGFVQAIEQSDTKYLQNFPGVGKKTASQIILDLQGKLSNLSPEVLEVCGSSEKKVENTNKELEEAIEALEVLGYSKTAIKKIKPTLEKLEKVSADEYIREGLKYLIY